MCIWYPFVLVETEGRKESGGRNKRMKTKTIDLTNCLNIQFFRGEMLFMVKFNWAMCEISSIIAIVILRYYIVWIKETAFWYSGVRNFVGILQAYLKLRTHASSKMGSPAKNSSEFLKAATTTLLHTISESEKSSYVAHINNYLGEDKFLKQYLPIDPSTNDLFEIVKDGVLLW